MFRSLLILPLLCLPALAETISFDKTWKEQRFLQLFTNDYRPKGEYLDFVSDGTISMFWRLTPASVRDATRASWDWAVSEGVGPSDLSKKGADDRNIALYFVFTSAKGEAAADNGSLRSFVTNKDTRVLIYVWGGDVKRGTFIVSPYSDQSRSIVLREPGTGAFREQVDLAKDFKKAFGTAPSRLVGLAVTGDSDDTGGRIVARISTLRVE